MVVEGVIMVMVIMIVVMVMKKKIMARMVMVKQAVNISFGPGTQTHSGISLDQGIPEDGPSDCKVFGAWGLLQATGALLIFSASALSLSPS